VIWDGNDVIWVHVILVHFTSFSSLIYLSCFSSFDLKHLENYQSNVSKSMRFLQLFSTIIDARHINLSINPNLMIILDSSLFFFSRFLYLIYFQFSLHLQFYQSNITKSMIFFQFIQSNDRCPPYKSFNRFQSHENPSFLSSYLSFFYYLISFQFSFHVSILSIQYQEIDEINSVYWVKSSNHW